jgi:ATP-dependent RNA helicase DDX3X
MGSPLEQAPYASMMSRELGAVVLSVSYRIGPFHQFPAAIHDAEDMLSAILDTSGTSKAGKVLREEIQRYYSMVRSNALDEKKKRPIAPHVEYVKDIVLDPTRLAISGFSAGGNIALNMALSVPPCPQMGMSTTMGSQSQTQGPVDADAMSPELPANRRATILDDPFQSWPSLLPSPEVQPRMLPLLLFYPSLDARLLPHERPMKPMPNALKPDDHHTEKPRRPGLFSIMGPTYLPKKLRAHPRASPGLNDPEHIQKNAAIFLVLPENDSLAVQSDVWVDKMRNHDWNGPVRFGDGREGDWDGHSGGQAGWSSASGAKNGGLEVWHAPSCRHGWTQFPNSFVPQHERRERDVVFTRTVEFVREKWMNELLSEGERQAEGANEEQNMRPLTIPSQFHGLEV